MSPKYRVIAFKFTPPPAGTPYTEVERKDVGSLAEAMKLAAAFHKQYGCTADVMRLKDGTYV